MALFPPLEGFGSGSSPAFAMTLSLSASDQLGDADVALGSTVGSNAGSVTYAWTVADPDGVDATASLDDATLADPTLGLSAYSGRVGGKWTATCTAADSLGSIVKTVEWQVGADGGFVLDTYDFSGTLNVSGSTLVIDGATFTLDTGSWTSDADGVQVIFAGSGVGASVTTPLTDLLDDSVETARIAVIFDDPLNLTTGTATSGNAQYPEIQARELDDAPLVSIYAEFSTVSPNGQGARLYRLSPASSLKVAVDVSTVTGLMYELTGLRSATNGQGFFRAYYSTVANPSLDTGLADWTEVGSGIPTGTEQPNDTAMGNLEFAIVLGGGASAAAYAMDVARIEVAAVR